MLGGLEGGGHMHARCVCVWGGALHMLGGWGGA